LDGQRREGDAVGLEVLETGVEVDKGGSGDSRDGLENALSGLWWLWFG
jgi:hypothetical protein